MAHKIKYKDVEKFLVDIENDYVTMKKLKQIESKDCISSNKEREQDSCITNKNKKEKGSEIEVCKKILNKNKEKNDEKDGCDKKQNKINENQDCKKIQEKTICDEIQNKNNEKTAEKNDCNTKQNKLNENQNCKNIQEKSSENDDCTKKQNKIDENQDCKKIQEKTTCDEIQKKNKEKTAEKDDCNKIQSKLNENQDCKNKEKTAEKDDCNKIQSKLNENQDCKNIQEKSNEKDDCNKIQNKINENQDCKKIQEKTICDEIQNKIDEKITENNECEKNQEKEDCSIIIDKSSEKTECDKINDKIKENNDCINKDFDNLIEKFKMDNSYYIDNKNPDIYKKNKDFITWYIRDGTQRTAYNLDIFTYLKILFSFNHTLLNNKDLNIFRLDVFGIENLKQNDDLPKLLKLNNDKLTKYTDITAQFYIKKFYNFMYGRPRLPYDDKFKKYYTNLNNDNNLCLAPAFDLLLHYYIKNKIKINKNTKEHEKFLCKMNKIINSLLYNFIFIFFILIHAVITINSIHKTKGSLNIDQIIFNDKKNNKNDTFTIGNKILHSSKIGTEPKIEALLEKLKICINIYLNNINGKNEEKYDCNKSQNQIEEHIKIIKTFFIELLNTIRNPLFFGVFIDVIYILNFILIINDLNDEDIDSFKIDILHKGRIKLLKSISTDHELIFSCFSLVNENNIIKLNINYIPEKINSFYEKNLEEYLKRIDKKLDGSKRLNGFLRRISKSIEEKFYKVYFKNKKDDLFKLTKKNCNNKDEIYVEEKNRLKSIFGPDIFTGLEIIGGNINLPKQIAGGKTTIQEIVQYIKQLKSFIKEENYKHLLKELQTSKIGKEYKFIYYFKMITKNSKLENSSSKKIKSIYLNIVAQILELFNLKLTKNKIDLNIDLYHYLLITKLNGKSYKFFKNDKLNNKLNTKKKYIRYFYAKHIKSQENLKNSFYYKLMSHINTLKNPDKRIFKFTNISKKKELKEFLIKFVENINDNELKNKYIVDLFGECILPSLQFYGKL